MSFDIDVSDLVPGDALEVSPHAGSRIITQLLTKGYTFYLDGNAIVIETIPDAVPIPAEAAVVPEPDPVPLPGPEPEPDPEPAPEPVKAESEPEDADPPLVDVAAEEAVIEDPPEPKRRTRAKKTPVDSVED